MAVPISQMWTVATYVIGQKIKGRKQYPLMLMLEPLFRCNLACAGCGKIQYPAHVLKAQLTPEECFRAVDECGAPTVSIPGGEPLLHPQIGEIVEGLVARKKYIYLCTNALLLKEKLHLFKPSKYLTFSIHMDGQREHHDFSVCLEGGYDKALEGTQEALKRGFRVTTNTTLFDGADPNSVRAFFDEMMELGVEGMMLSPGYSYDKAPDQSHFLGRARTRRLFRGILSNRKTELALQHVAAVSRVSDGQTRLRLHPVGYADVQRLRLAETLLSVARRLRRHLRRVAGVDRLGKIRHGIRQPQVRQLHGAQRLRSFVGESYVWFAERACGARPRLRCSPRTRIPQR